jgi:hypothetical protein
MSKYADKHRHQAECTHPTCEDPGTKLIMIAGKPYWVCERHADNFEARRTAVS